MGKRKWWKWKDLTPEEQQANKPPVGCLVVIGGFVLLIMIAGLFGEKDNRPYKPFYTNKTNVYAENMVRDMNIFFSKGFTHHEQVDRLDYAVEVLCEKAVLHPATQKSGTFMVFVSQYEPAFAEAETEDGKSQTQINWRIPKLMGFLSTYCAGVIRNP